MLGTHPRLRPHFHIALQSGSDKVLKDMRRIYKAEEFYAVAEKIQTKAPHTFVGLDVIVGFPGESEGEFLETERCLESTFWTKLHVFPFSARHGTLAERMEGKVRAAAITERSERLRQLSEKRYAAFLNSEIGKTRDVLLERPSVNIRPLARTYRELPAHIFTGTPKADGEDDRSAHSSPAPTETGCGQRRPTPLKSALTAVLRPHARLAVASLLHASSLHETR